MTERQTPLTSTSITLNDFPSVGERCETLGVRRPLGLAMLPRNFATAAPDEELLAEAADAAVRTLWHQASIDEDRLDLPEGQFARLSEHHADWIGPIILSARRSSAKHRRSSRSRSESYRTT
jgi:hypothetical protein